MQRPFTVSQKNNPMILTHLTAIREAEALIATIRADLADSWRNVGSMLRDIRNQKSLTQAQAAALIGKSAAIVVRWEKGSIVSADEILEYIKKLDKV
jgi:DNA-binding XRE family transcriptional regulator